MSEQKPTVTFDDFLKLDLRTAKVLEVTDHPNADKLLVIKIDLGGGEQRQIIAGLKTHYAPEALVGKQIVVVTNLQSRKMRGMESHGMLLAAVVKEGEAQNITVITVDKEVPAGSPVS